MPITTAHESPYTPDPAGPVLLWGLMSRVWLMANVAEAAMIKRPRSEGRRSDGRILNLCLRATGGIDNISNAPRLHCRVAREARRWARAGAERPTIVYQGP